MVEVGVALWDLERVGAGIWGGGGGWRGVWGLGISLALVSWVS